MLSSELYPLAVSAARLERNSIHLPGNIGAKGGIIPVHFAVRTIESNNPNSPQLGATHALGN